MGLSIRSAIVEVTTLIAIPYLSFLTWAIYEILFRLLSLCAYSHVTELTALNDSTFRGKCFRDAVINLRLNTTNYRLVVSSDHIRITSSNLCRCKVVHIRNLLIGNNLYIYIILQVPYKNIF